MSEHLELSSVTFRYESQAENVFSGLDVHFSSGWTGIIGANGSGKTTLLQLACGDLQPREGMILGDTSGHYCAQRTDDQPEHLKALFDATDVDAHRLIGQLDISQDWLNRWQSLSHGERKRAQIAVALWKNPTVLAVDEPTNHVDSACRKLVLNALRQFNGIGLLVSHDRELLDQLCARCLFLDPPDVQTFRGGYTEAVEQKRAQEAFNRKQHKSVKQQVSRLRKESHRRQAEVSRSHARSSKRGLAVKDHDARSKKDLARLTGKDGSAGQRHQQMQTRIKQKTDELQQIRVKKEYQLGVAYRGEVKKGDAVYSSGKCTLQLGPDRTLAVPALNIRPSDRIAVVGDNGSGKTTLIRHILTSHSLPRQRVVHLPQEISIEREKEIIKEVKALPRDHLGDVMTIVSRLGSRPGRLFDSELFSPGELRKLLLALGLLNKPWLIIMDEPTNHLDLPSIEVLEEALSEVTCALLLVSHDRQFLNRLTNIQWEIQPSEENNEQRMQLVSFCR